MTAKPSPSASSSTSSSLTSSAPAFAVKVVDNATLGSYLVNGSGFTLYYFALDTVGNATSPPVSACNTAQACISVWPAFYAANLVVPSGLNASDFTTFKRADGQPQTAYKGHPLYLYLGDTSPGAVTGNDIDINGGYWYVASVNGTMP
ncbi:MAG: hypothetical protein JRM86_00285 [Nitrososphaerota archaeon]|nr:hypothetical protein [Nitrososphaerota archaeon]